jgi:hypothetical protein
LKTRAREMKMATEGKHARLVQTKLALARKYENLARAVSSRPRKTRLMHQAARYRRQAEDLARR